MALTLWHKCNYVSLFKVIAWAFSLVHYSNRFLSALAGQPSV